MGFPETMLMNDWPWIQINSFDFAASSILAVCFLDEAEITAITN
jgi:hypothetical protein